jgi:hypothetical protein
MSVALENIPASEGVRKVAPGGGERFDVAGAHLTWKLFALVDHSGEAAKVGMRMLPTKLLIFGNPNGARP